MSAAAFPLPQAPGRPLHPPHLGYRLVRSLRVLRSLRGWRSLADRIAPPAEAAAFCVRNQGAWFAGDTGSFIDREAYLYEGYETDQINAFLALFPAHRRRTLLDIGANVGTHSLRFAQSFATVHAFEPAPAVFAQLSRNIALNPDYPITAHPIGLGERQGILPFYTLAKANRGLGTLLSHEQYDMPLVRAGEVRVEQGDAVVAAAGIETVDALKIDVQGYEAAVLKGLQETLARWRPTVWFEFGGGTKTEMANLSEASALFPYSVRFLRFARTRAGAFYRYDCRQVDTQAGFEAGDFIALPVQERA